jgi:hypothetical protein
MKTVILRTHKLTKMKTTIKNSVYLRRSLIMLQGEENDSC